MTTLSPSSPLHPTTTKLPSNPPHPVSLISKRKSLTQLKQIHAFCIKNHLQNDTDVITKLINHCTKEPTQSSMDHARQLFDKIPQPDIALFNSMARGYARTTFSLHAIHLFAQILTSAEAFPDHYTFPCLLKACANAKALQEGRQVHALATKHGLSCDTYVSPSLINLYSECSEMGSARRVFDGIRDPCVVCYNSIIAGCLRNYMPNEALSLFREMQHRNVAPTYVTMLSVLSVCSSLGSLELGRWIHEFVKVNKYDQHVKVSTGLIDMYAKCGSLEDSELIFQAMFVRDRQAWSAMIVAYAIHGNSARAISTFEEMTRVGFEPDEVTFLGLLYACSHTCLVDQGYDYLYTMRNTYGVEPTVKHYGCVVDMLSRAGRLEEAYRFIEELPINPTPILWRTLLYACCRRQNLDLAKKVVDRIFQLDDSHGGDYVMISHLCARVGQREDVNRYRRAMHARGAVKVPGCSSIEVNGVVHEFFSGGNGSVEAQLKGLLFFLDGLAEELKRAGYRPDLSLVHHAEMDDDEKEVSLRYHSEKIAIAFALMNTKAGTTIRVIKNLRVCGDCHSAAKIMSLMFDRKIILRDVNRFHHFDKGECSCGDCW